MDLAARKYNFIERLFDIDEILLGKLELILFAKENAKPINLQEYNIELNQADLRIENGDFYTAEEVEKMTSQW